MKTNKKFFIILSVITIALFTLYLGKFSENNFARHRNLNQQIEEWNTKIRKAKNHIDDSGYDLDKLKNDPNLLEKYAREQLNMHKVDEDVYMIVYE